MGTYIHGFEFRKWPKSRRRRCGYCRRVFAATAPSTKYCRTCSAGLLGQVQFISDGRPPMAESEPRLLDASADPHACGHFAEIDYMARDQHGRAMLAPFLLRQHEARMSREVAQDAQDARSDAGPSVGTGAP
jgi:hypothetical protein